MISSQLQGASPSTPASLAAYLADLQGASPGSPATMGVLAAAVAASTAYADASRALPQALASSVPAQGGALYCAAHRAGGSAQGGGANYQGPYPEEFLEGYRAAVAAGVTCLNVHVRMLADGALVCMHDATPDRTTTATGSINVASYTTAGWRQLTGTPQNWTGYGVNWGTVYPPFLEDVLREFGGRVLLMIEADSAGTTAQPAGSAGAAITAALVRHGLTACAIVTSFQAAELTAPAAAGIQTMYFPPNYGTTGYLASAITTAMAAGWGAGLPQNVGINAFGGTQAQIQAYIPALVSAGFRVWAWTVIRRSDAAWLQAAGCSLLITDEPVYLPSATAVSTSGQDPTAISATWPHGILPPYNIAYGRGNVAHGGVQLDYVPASGSLQYWVTYGSLCPAAGTTYTIQASIAYDQLDSDTSRWAGLYVCCPDDSVTTGSAGTSPGFANGYTIILRQTGQLACYLDNGGATQTQSQVGSSQSTTAITVAGTVATVAVAVSPTALAVTVTIASTAYGPFTFTDSTYRGGYFHIGKACGSSGTRLICTFKNVSA